MADLRKCPFCGGKAKVCDDIEYTVGGYWVECKDCHIQTPSKIKGKEAVINYWNTRKPMEAVVAELEKKSEEYNEKADRYSVHEDYFMRYLSIAKGIDTAISIVRGKE